VRFRGLEAGGWKLIAGSWKLEAGSWKLEVGSKMQKIMNDCSKPTRENRIKLPLRQRALG
jgi:hypothetical protein